MGLLNRLGSRKYADSQRINVGKQDGAYPKMVGWYDPGQLARTALEVIVSTQFGRKADRRLESFGSTAQEDPFDYTVDENGVPREELWIDYVADLGDGWDSTYTVAYHVAQKSLVVSEPSSKEEEKEQEKKAPARVSTNATPNATNQHELRRADVLVFGGDQVYPTASRKEYQDRLMRPYETALRDSASPSPDVFAIPGNHDWYDNLVAFTRLFCTGRWFAGWKTRQKRSYFALKLPQKWWLIGTDVQLDSDIDAPQLKYFRDIADQMGEDDKIILLLAEPHWITAKVYNKYDTNYNESNLAFLEQKIFHRKIAVYIAGDLHHYRRHEDSNFCQKITAGGGGAFLHPTHGQDVEQLAGGYALKASYPKVEDSRKLTWRNLNFPFINPLFGVVTGLLYLLIAWGVKADLSQFSIGQVGPAIAYSFRYLLQSQVAVLWALLLIGGFILFTETHSRWYRAVAGTLHALSHLSAVFFVGWIATAATVDISDTIGSLPMLGFFNGLDTSFASPTQLLLGGLLVFALGWLVGPLIVGIYFIISLNVFGRHVGESFSSLRIADYKHFLRMKVDSNGLTIYPIKFDKIWKAWKIQPGGIEHSELVPDTDAKESLRGSPPTLIEPPISYVCCRTL